MHLRADVGIRVPQMNWPRFRFLPYPGVHGDGRVDRKCDWDLHDGWIRDGVDDLRLDRDARAIIRREHDFDRHRSFEVPRLDGDRAIRIGTKRKVYGHRRGNALGDGRPRGLDDIKPWIV